MDIRTGRERKAVKRWQRLWFSIILNPKFCRAGLGWVFVLAWRMFGKLSAHFSANSSANFSCWFSSLVSPGFRRPPASKVHPQNPRPELSAFLQRPDFWKLSYSHRFSVYRGNQSFLLVSLCPQVVYSQSESELSALVRCCAWGDNHGTAFQGFRRQTGEQWLCSCCVDRKDAHN